MICLSTNKHFSFQLIEPQTRNTTKQRHGFMDQRCALSFSNSGKGWGSDARLPFWRGDWGLGISFSNLPVGRNLKGTRNQSCTVIYKLIEIMWHISSWLITEPYKTLYNCISIGTTSEVGTVSMKQPKRIIWKLLNLKPWSWKNSPQNREKCIDFLGLDDFSVGLCSIHPHWQFINFVELRDQTSNLETHWNTFTSYVATVLFWGHWIKFEDTW